jgi:hypothetical protein
MANLITKLIESYCAFRKRRHEEEVKMEADRRIRVTNDDDGIYVTVDGIRIMQLTESPGNGCDAAISIMNRIKKNFIFMHE